MNTYLLHMKNGDVVASDDYVQLRDYWIINAGKNMDRIEVLTPNEAEKLFMNQPSLTHEISKNATVAHDM